MDIGANQIVGEIASSTSQYMVVYLPIFLLVCGLVLAIVVIESLITVFFRRNGMEDPNDPDERRAYDRHFGV